MRELPVRQKGVCCEIGIETDVAWAEDTAEVLKALGEPTRLSMIATLWKAQEPICICDFTGAFQLTQPTISHHMAKLKAAGLVESRKKGIWIYYQLRRELPPGPASVLSALFGERPASS